MFDVRFPYGPSGKISIEREKQPTNYKPVKDQIFGPGGEIRADAIRPVWI